MGYEHNERQVRRFFPRSTPDYCMHKRHAPAAERNRKPILEVLRQTLPPSGVVLEVAAGTGQHAAYFASELPSLVWQPSDISPAALDSIAAYVTESRLENLRPPLRLDVCAQPWPITEAAAVLCINMIHIAPWDASRALFEGAQRILASGSPLITYGPYKVGGAHTSASNASFDASLRSQNPDWGVRDIDELRALASDNDFALENRIAMPANNQTLVWRSGATSAVAQT